MTHLRHRPGTNHLDSPLKDRSNIGNRQCSGFVMGCIGSRDEAVPPAGTAVGPGLKDGKISSYGQVGGDVSLKEALSPNEAAAQAAKARQLKTDSASGNEESRKQEVLGRIEALYAQRNESRPVGLGMKSYKELKTHLDAMRAGTR